MSNTLVLLGGDAPTAPVSWVVVGAGGRIVAEGSSIDNLPPSAPPARTALVIPAADTRLKRLQLPARSEAQARAGAEALFGKELSLADEMHYAVGPQQDADGRRLVAAIAAERMRQWLACAHSLGCDPAFVALDCCLWPADDDAVVVGLVQTRAIVSAGAEGGFSIEPELAAAVLGGWLKAARIDRPRIVVEASETDLDRAGFGAEVTWRPLGDPVHKLAEAAAAPPRWAPNLRQGAFVAATEGAQPFKLWRFAALLAAAAVLLQVGSLALAGWRDNRAADQIMAAAERDFRAARPEMRRVVNLRAQVNAAANALDQAARHPVIVTAPPLIQALQAQPAARIDDLRHEAPERTVRLTVSAPRAAELEAFIAALRQSGAQVEARNVQPREGRHVAELSMEAP